MQVCDVTLTNCIYPKKLAQDVNSFNILFCLCIMIFASENIQIKTCKTQ